MHRSRVSRWYVEGVLWAGTDMMKTMFTDERIVGSSRQAEAGVTVKELVPPE
jgi:hypothetical protein